MTSTDLGTGGRDHVMQGKEWDISVHFLLLHRLEGGFGQGSRLLESQFLFL